MSAYRKKWIEVLKNKQIPGWSIDEHGQAIVIRVPADEETQIAEKQVSATLNTLSTEIQVPKEWLKFIFFNEKLRFEYILNPEIRIKSNL